jgi:uncharacterized protein (DUF983 family)
MTDNEIKEAREARRCKCDGCEHNRCPKCGAHTLGWLDTFQMCNHCELEEESRPLERDTPLAELLDDDQGISDQFNPISGEMD